MKRWKRGGVRTAEWARMDGFLLIHFHSIQPAFPLSLSSHSSLSLSLQLPVSVHSSHQTETYFPPSHVRRGGVVWLLLESLQEQRRGQNNLSLYLLHVVAEVRMEVESLVCHGHVQACTTERSLKAIDSYLRRKMYSIESDFFFFISIHGHITKYMHARYYQRECINNWYWALVCTLTRTQSSCNPCPVHFTAAPHNPVPKAWGKSSLQHWVNFATSASHSYTQTHTLLNAWLMEGEHWRWQHPERLCDSLCSPFFNLSLSGLPPSLSHFVITLRLFSNKIKKYQDLSLVDTHLQYKHD